MQIKEYAVRLMEESGSFEYTRQSLKSIKESLMVEIEKLGGNPLLVGIITALSVVDE